MVGARFAGGFGVGLDIHFSENKVNIVDLDSCVN